MDAALLKFWAFDSVVEGLVVKLLIIKNAIMQVVMMGIEMFDLFILFFLVVKK